MPDGQVVLNHDDPGSRELGERLPSAALAWYGMDRPGRGALEAWLEDGWLVVGGERVVSAEDVRLPGRHMLADVLGAALAAHLIGVDASAIATVARTFAGVPHRLETVAERNGVRWINDSQATIPQAAIAALEAFDSPIVLIAGGKDKGLDYAAFADAIASRVRALVLIGETADELESARRQPRAGEASVVDGRGRGRRRRDRPSRGHRAAVAGGRELRHVRRLCRPRRRLPRRRRADWRQSR